jgi:cbb3-type cytochrome oxidase subunit 3
MRHTLILGILLIAAVFLAWGQRDRSADPAAYEIKSLFPRETSPAHYEQVENHQIQALAESGWELVAVVPYIYRNEERGTPDMAPRPMATQVYPAYFFKRRAAR